MEQENYNKNKAHFKRVKDVVIN